MGPPNFRRGPRGEQSPQRKKLLCDQALVSDILMMSEANVAYVLNGRGALQTPVNVGFGALSAGRVRNSHGRSTPGRGRAPNLSPVWKSVVQFRFFGSAFGKSLGGRVQPTGSAVARRRRKDPNRSDGGRNDVSATALKKARVSRRGENGIRQKRERLRTPTLAVGQMSSPCEIAARPKPLKPQ